MCEILQVEEGCKLRQIALVSTHAPHTDEGDNTLDPKEDTDTVSTESTDHRLTSLNDISSAGSCEDDWARNPEFCSSGSSASVHIGCMDFPLRTIDRHLAELGQRALHKGLFLPSEDTVQVRKVACESKISWVPYVQGIVIFIVLRIGPLFFLIKVTGYVSRNSANLHNHTQVRYPCSYGG